MRVRLVSLAAILAVIGPVAPALAQAQVPVAPAISPQAEPLPAAPVSQLVSEVDIPWTRFQLDNLPEGRWRMLTAEERAALVG